MTDAHSQASSTGGWQTIIASSSVMTLALLGDALLYAVLPVYAADFGLTLPWVGVMLSANRFVRVFAYGAIVRLSHTVGIRRMCIGGAIAATLSTALYGVSQGPAMMLAARILWGLTYASLLLATLSYAIEFRHEPARASGSVRPFNAQGRYSHCSAAPGSPRPSGLTPLFSSSQP